MDEQKEEKLKESEISRLQYAVEDGRLDLMDAEDLLKDPKAAREWLAKHDIDYDPY